MSDVPADQNYACYDYLDVWSAPHIMSVATQDRLLDLAQGYFGGAPTLYSINAFWSFPNRQPHPYSQVFHRDWEDYRSLVAFTLLTPVDDPEDYTFPVWAGVVPLNMVAGKPLPDPRLDPAYPVPSYAENYSRKS